MESLRVVPAAAVIFASLVFLGSAAGGSRIGGADAHRARHTFAGIPGLQVVSADPSHAGSVVSRHGVMSIPPGTAVVPGRLLVRFRPGVARMARSNALAHVHASVGRAYNLVPGLKLLRLPAGSSVADAATALSRDPRVLYVGPDLAVKEAATRTDPLYPGQWALPAIGAPAAWARTTGGADVTVAVLDSGVALGHPDLAANLVPGWNFLNNTADPSDDFGHGTHVAGIIGAVGGGGMAVAGVAPHVRLMPLKICDSQGICSLDKEVSALQYAVAHGAKIANASFGGFSGGYQPEEDAIAAAGKAGLLYVAAAGNAGFDNQLAPFYPASYPLDNIISVAATTSSGGLASFSNYGFDSVLTAAPGENILSTMLTRGPLSDPSGYGALSGTSMAAPEVAGAAALLWAEHPDWTMQQVRMRLLTTASPLASLAGEVADCGQLNVAAATDPTLPDEGIVCVKLSGTGGGSVVSDLGGIDCGATCVAAVPVGMTLSLSAEPHSGSTFAGWGGACSGVGSCAVSASGIGDVTATFLTSGSPSGWQQDALQAPAGRDPFAPGSAFGPGDSSTFYNVAVSADGSERAETIVNPPSGPCDYDSSDTGGVFLEHRTTTGWVADGEVTAPSVPAYAGDPGARWENCSEFGTITQLSADGTTLLVAPDMANVWDPGPSARRYRCAAYVYQRGSGGWVLETTLYPPGVDARGSLTWDGCGYFGIGGAISGDGTRVAMTAAGLDASGATVLKADMYTRSQGTWSLEQQLTLPSPNSDCAHTVGPRILSLSGDGASLLVGSPDCDNSGITQAGLVYAYERSGTQWTLTQTIAAPAPLTTQRFGLETALSQDGATATIGSWGAHGDATWVFERNQAGWHMSALLPHAAPPQYTVRPFFECPTIVQDGARIICGAFDDVGFNRRVGSIYVYDRPAGGWDSSQRQTTDAFATDGVGSDLLGQGESRGWLTLAAPEDGSFIDAPISPTRFASGLYPHDRIGYEFTTSGDNTAAPTDKTLNVTVGGGGSGSVTSDSTGIDCGSVCWNDYAAGSSVALTATAANGSVFTGWTGDCSGSGPCTLSMSADRSVGATFTPLEPLSVTKYGSGGALVTSNPVGISCGSNCAHSYVYGTSVQLSATPAAGWSFTGWTGGGCSGAGSCRVSMTRALSVAATFVPLRESLSLTELGKGIVTSSPAGIRCGSTCAHSYKHGMTVQLKATPAKRWIFAGWTGGGCSGTRTCSVSMIQARSVLATFAPISQRLSVTKAGKGSVTSSPAGISCGSICAHSYHYGVTVQLKTTPAKGWIFAGWTGGVCTGTSSCTVSMTQARKVTATFALHP